MNELMMMMPAGDCGPLGAGLGGCLKQGPPSATHPAATGQTSPILTPSAAEGLLSMLPEPPRKGLSIAAARSAATNRLQRGAEHVAVLRQVRRARGALLW